MIETLALTGTCRMVWSSARSFSVVKVAELLNKCTLKFALLPEEPVLSLAEMMGQGQWF